MVKSKERILMDTFLFDNIFHHDDWVEGGVVVDREGNSSLFVATTKKTHGYWYDF
jgi:hypothetical protein